MSRLATASASSPGGEVVRVLRGFDRFLDLRPLTFLDEPPRGLLCAHCGHMNPYAWRLPCGHTLCGRCRDVVLARPLLPDCPRNSSAARCPADGRRFFRLEQVGPEVLTGLRVRCLNAPLGCDFVGPVRDLERHCERKCAYVPGRGRRKDIVSQLVAQRGPVPPRVAADEKRDVASELVARVRDSTARVAASMIDVHLRVAQERAKAAEEKKKRRQSSGLGYEKMHYWFR